MKPFDLKGSLVKDLSQAHMSSEWENKDLNPSNLVGEFIYFF